MRVCLKSYLENKEVPMLKNLSIALLIITSTLFAQSNEVCYPNIEIPEGTCSYQSGYICGLAYDMPSNGPTGYNHNLNFYIGNDPTCADIAQTSIWGAANKNLLRIFYYENPDEYADALNLSIVTSIAISAANNRYPVNVIYKKIPGSKKNIF